MRTPMLLATTATALLAGGCTMRLDERVTGAAIGTGAGALAGGLISGGVGAGVGAAAGGTAGYFIGKHVYGDRVRQERLEAMRPDASDVGEGPTVAAADPVPPPPRTVAPPRALAPAPAPADPAEAARRAYEAGRRATSAGEAMRLYEEASRLDPSRPEPHNARGMLLAWQGRNDEARQAYARAIALDPSYAPAVENLHRLSPGR